MFCSKALCICTTVRVIADVVLIIDCVCCSIAGWQKSYVHIALVELHLIAMSHDNKIYALQHESYAPLGKNVISVIVKR